MTITATPKLDAACNVRHKTIDIDGARPDRRAHPFFSFRMAIPHHLSSIDISCRCSQIAGV